MKQIGYVYQHRPTGDYIRLHYDDIGTPLFSMYKKLSPDFIFYNRELVIDFLIDSIDSFGEKYAKANFSEFELRTVEITMTLL